MLHHTKNKGDVAATKAIADLTSKGYLIFTPVVCEHLPFDFIAYKDKKYYRIEVVDGRPKEEFHLPLTPEII